MYTFDLITIFYSSISCIRSSAPGHECCIAVWSDKTFPQITQKSTGSTLSGKCEGVTWRITATATNSRFMQSHKKKKAISFYLNKETLTRIIYFSSSHICTFILQFSASPVSWLGARSCRRTNRTSDLCCPQRCRISTILSPTPIARSVPGYSQSWYYTSTYTSKPGTVYHTTPAN